MRKAEQVLELIRETGIVRPRDLEARGISRAYLRELVEAGLVMRSGRGTYFVVDGAITEKHSLAEVCQRVPHGVICLLSALQFHDLTTQWQAFVRRGLDGREAPSLPDVITVLKPFVLPLFETLRGERESPGIWPPGGPWTGSSPPSRPEPDASLAFRTGPARLTARACLPG